MKAFYINLRFLNVALFHTVIFWKPVIFRSRLQWSLLMSPVCRSPAPRWTVRWCTSSLVAIFSCPPGPRTRMSLLMRKCSTSSPVAGSEMEILWAQGVGWHGVPWIFFVQLLSCFYFFLTMPHDWPRWSFKSCHLLFFLNFLFCSCLNAYKHLCSTSGLTLRKEANVLSLPRASPSAEKCVLQRAATFTDSCFLFLSQNAWCVESLQC